MRFMDFFGAAMAGRAAALTLGAAVVATLAPTQAAAAAGLCRKQAFEGVGYVVCEASLDRHEVRMFLNDRSGQPYGRLARLVDSAPGANLLMAINGGMYRDDRSPVGLYVENGRQIRAANTRNGAGNFHLKPNGVFYVTATGAGVATTERFLKTKPKALYATQSGPMLVINGKLHPRFAEEGASAKIRNGVGVRGKMVVFAISEQPVSFGAFGRLFRDELKTPNALYLDGTISSIFAPDVGRRDWLYPVGPIIGVAPRAPASPERRAGTGR